MQKRMNDNQMDAQLERITSINQEAARWRETRHAVSMNVARNLQAEREALIRRRKAVYRTAFHAAALVTAGALIWGLSEMSTGSPLAGLVICLGAVGFGFVGCILDCLGGE